jgi:DNA repair exonuclease SbcCD ATPase subunit
MSINDFKNFISLSNEDKKVLLDKMFNLEYINMLNSILKTIISDNKNDIDVLNKEIQTLDNSIEQIKASLKKATDKLHEKIEIDYNEQLEVLKADFAEKKQMFNDSKIKLDTGRQKHNELKEKIDAEKTSYVETCEKIKQINIKLKLYENGKCPTCESSLETDFHSSIKNDLLNQFNTLNNIKITLEDNIKKYRVVEDKANNYINKTIQLNSKLNSELNNIKTQKDNILSKMKQVNEVIKNDDSLKEFENTIKKISNQKTIAEDKKLISEDKKSYHKILSTILGENGVKNIIIRNILLPINTFIQQNAIMLNLPFDIELTENFDAIIRHFGEEINSETLSTGEMRKVNLSIMIAYLKLIRTKININILFLDEIFSSIDVESIKDVISLLKEFANEYKINIFIVHHSHLDSESFDRVIRINKNVFSSIEEININNMIINSELNTNDII